MPEVDPAAHPFFVPRSSVQRQPITRGGFERSAEIRTGSRRSTTATQIACSVHPSPDWVVGACPGRGFDGKVGPAREGSALLQGLAAVAGAGGA